MSAFYGVTVSLCLLVLILAGVSADSVATGPKHSAVVEFWKIAGPAMPARTVDFTIGLTVQDKDTLENLFWSVSDPGSPSYKQYLSIKEIQERFGRSDAELASLVQWLQRSLPLANVKVVDTKNAVVVSHASVKSVEKLFGIAMVELESKRGDRAIRCADTVSVCDLKVPREYRGLIGTIEGLVDFPPRKLGSVASSATNINITPKQLYEQYNVPILKSINCNNTAQTVAEFSGSNWIQSYDPADLHTFQKTYDLLIQPVTKQYGVNNPDQPTGEASLDIQYIMAAAQGVPTWFWGETGTFLNYLIHIENEQNGPLVHSISYSIGDENEIDPSHMALLNQHFQIIALRGISLIWASGDDGTGNTGFFGCGVFSPGFPASSPYITSVGATSFTAASSMQPNALRYAHHAASYSGGGFSNYFARPAYQDAFVKQYFADNKNSLPPAAYYNSSGRGYPDVAVAGTNFMIFVGGFSGPPMPVSGTSAATPVFSAMLTMINNELVAQGKKSVGFVNPALYRAPSSVWEPITQGTNPYYPCDVGFQAAAPWAPISGLGSPKYPSLLSYLLSSSK